MSKKQISSVLLILVDGFFDAIEIGNQHARHSDGANGGRSFLAYLLDPWTHQAMRHFIL